MVGCIHVSSRYLYLRTSQHLSTGCNMFKKIFQETFSFRYVHHGPSCICSIYISSLYIYIYISDVLQHGIFFLTIASYNISPSLSFYSMSDDTLFISSCDNSQSSSSSEDGKRPSCARANASLASSVPAINACACAIRCEFPTCFRASTS